MRRRGHPDRPDAVELLRELAAEGSIAWERREYAGAEDLEGVFMVIAATSDTDVNIRIYDDAERRAMLVNVVDVPPLCNFILPAIIRPVRWRSRSRRPVRRPRSPSGSATRSQTSTASPTRGWRSS